MKVIVFTGPTLLAREAGCYLDADYRPPAAVGDVYQAALDRPDAIGIVDGYYETAPSVWHKEVLWALKEGIRVYGAASMGALRAAELSDFGMIGVGTIFEDFHRGFLEDDDEVAVLHGPAMLGYPQISEAMVNIRATLQRAVAEGIVDQDAANEVLKEGRATFWKTRNYEDMLTTAIRNDDQRKRLQDWLPAHRVNRKREDAIAMLQRISADRHAESPPCRFKFEHTTAWETVRRRYVDAGDGEAALFWEDVLDELRLTPGAYAAIRRRATLRAFSLRALSHEDWDASVAQLQEAVRVFARSVGVFSPVALDDWMQSMALSREEFLRLMREEARFTALESEIGSVLNQALLDELRLEGRQAALLARVRDKHNRLSESGWDDIGVVDTGLDAAALIEWYRNSVDIHVADADMLAAVLGFESRVTLLRALAREYCFRHRSAS